MIASIGPFWDANETWLVLGVGILLIAFPKAHGMVLGALYLPVALMLIGLILRGVAFDFRVKAQATRTSRCGTACSSPARRSPSVAQGWMLGRYVSGFGSGWNYPLFAAAIARRAADGLRAARRLLADHEDRRRTAAARGRAGPGIAWAPMVAGLVLISMATPWVSATVRERWFALPELIALMAIPLMTGVALLAVRARAATRSSALGALCWLPFVLLIVGVRARLPRPGLQHLPVRGDRPADDLAGRQQPRGAEGDPDRRVHLGAGDRAATRCFRTACSAARRGRWTMRDSSAGAAARLQ